MDQLESLYGVGPVLGERLKEILAPFQLKTFEEVKHKLRDRDIFRTLPILTQVDLLYNPTKSIPRVVIQEIEKELVCCIRGIKWNIAGSYIRKKPLSRDIDLVVLRGKKDIIKEVNSCSKSIYIYPPYAQGTEKISIILEYLVPASLQHFLPAATMTTTKKIRIKTDIFLTDVKSYIFTLLFATGSGEFNMRMRTTAKKRGYLLNQHGIYKRDSMKPVKIKTERDIFEFLGMTYKKPEERIV